MSKKPPAHFQQPTFGTFSFSTFYTEKAALERQAQNLANYALFSKNSSCGCPAVLAAGEAARSYFGSSTEEVECLYAQEEYRSSSTAPATLENAGHLQGVAWDVSKPKTLDQYNWETAGQGPPASPRRLSRMGSRCGNSAAMSSDAVSASSPVARAGGATVQAPPKCAGSLNVDQTPTNRSAQRPLSAARRSSSLRTPSSNTVSDSSSRLMEPCSSSGASSADLLPDALDDFKRARCSESPRVVTPSILSTSSAPELDSLDVLRQSLPDKATAGQSLSGQASPKTEGTRVEEVGVFGCRPIAGGLMGRARGLWAQVTRKT